MFPPGLIFLRMFALNAKLNRRNIGEISIEVHKNFFIFFSLCRLKHGSRIWIGMKTMMALK